MKRRHPKKKANAAAPEALPPAHATWRHVMFAKSVFHALVLFAWSAVALPVAAVAQQSVPPDQAEKDALRALILQTIRENPQILVETIQSYAAQQQADAEAATKEKVARAIKFLRSDENAGFMGNADGDVLIVEFFDYNCPYCRRATPILSDLIDENPGLRIVLREWPILGPDSELAARASLAAFKQGRYAAFHEALMDKPRANAATVRQAAEETGLDYERLLQDMNTPEVDSHLKVSQAIAERLGIKGTPAFLIGDTLIPGLLGRADLQALISQVADAE